MGKKLSVDWTKHCKDAEAKANFEQLVRNSTQVLSRLQSIIKERQTNLSSEENSSTDFDSPSWAYKQAFRNGKRATLNDLDQLLSFLT